MKKVLRWSGTGELSDKNKKPKKITYHGKKC